MVRKSMIIFCFVCVALMLSTNAEALQAIDTQDATNWGDWFLPDQTDPYTEPYYRWGDEDWGWDNRGCLPATQCVTHDDCDGWQHCKDGYCEQTCVTDQDCRRDWEDCDEARGVCHEWCVINSDCYWTDFCNSRQFCEPIVCETSSDCPGGSCDLYLQQCDT